MLLGHNLGHIYQLASRSAKPHHAAVPHEAPLWNAVDGVRIQVRHLRVQADPSSADEMNWPAQGSI